MLTRVVMAFVAAVAVMQASPLHAQDPDADGEPRFYVGIQGQYARPVGEFSDYVEHGGGLNVNIAWPVQRGSVLALRADGGFIVYGSETRRVCFSQTVGCFVQLDLTTTNSIAYLNAGPQLMLPYGPIRPYVNAAIGGSYFGTSSSVSGTHGGEDFASSTNFDDITLAWNGGGGLLLSLSSGATPVLLDVGVRYTGNGEVEYLKKGDIVEDPDDNSLIITPTRSEANLLTFQIGVQIGVSGRRTEF